MGKIKGCALKAAVPRRLLFSLPSCLRALLCRLQRIYWQ